MNIHSSTERHKLLTVSSSDNRFLNPEHIVKHFGLRRGDVVADFGAGHAYFSIPMARIVGGDGKIYALDIQKNAIAVIRTKAQREHLLHIEPIWTDLEQPHGSTLRDAFIDVVVITNILAQVRDKAMLFEEAFRILHEEGRLIVIEWDAAAHAIGPSAGNRVQKETVIALAKDAHFVLIDTLPTGAHHYGFVFEKTKSTV